MSIIGTAAPTPSNLPMSTGLQSAGDASAQLSQALATKAASAAAPTGDMLQQESGLVTPAGGTAPTDAQSLGAMLSSPSALNPSGNEAVGMANWGGFLPAGQATGSVPPAYTGAAAAPSGAAAIPGSVAPAPSGAVTGAPGSIVSNPPAATPAPSGAATGLFGLVN